MLDTGEEVRLQRNALAVVSVPKGDETVRRPSFVHPCTRPLGMRAQGSSSRACVRLQYTLFVGCQDKRSAVGRPDSREVAQTAGLHG